MQRVSLSYSSSIYATNQNGALSRVNSRSTAPGEQVGFVSGSAPSEDNTSISAKGWQLSKNNNLPDKSEDAKARHLGEQNLTQEELQTITELQKRDTEVRAHEQAHLSAAGQYATGGASFSYVTGPNGKRYTNGGEVPIDISREKTPEATIQKMRTVRRAALAPANPSGADRGIAAQASSMEAAAMKELQSKPEVSASTSRTAENGGSTESATNQDADNGGERQVSGVDSSSQITGVSRKSMTSAYQAIAALAA